MPFQRLSGATDTINPGKPQRMLSTMLDHLINRLVWFQGPLSDDVFCPARVEFWMCPTIGSALMTGLWRGYEAVEMEKSW